MFDTMTITKAGASVCAALLIFLFANWAADSLYAGQAEAHGDEDTEHSVGYVIASVSEGGEEAATEEEGPSFEEVFASADAAEGEKVYGKCKACHKLDGSNGVGPHLDGVVGRQVASIGDYSYSSGMMDHGGDWTPEALQEFLANPKGVVNGTKMTFSGLKDIEDRANVIAYLQAQ